MTMKKLEPAGLPVLTMGSADAGLDMAGWTTELVSRARSQGVELGGHNGLLTAMVRLRSAAVGLLRPGRSLWKVLADEAVGVLVGDAGAKWCWGSSLNS